MDTEQIQTVPRVPEDRRVVIVDVRDLPPPEPLTETMDALADLGPDELLVQMNDRVPQHLFPRLEDHGVEVEYVETDDGAMAAIWRPEN